MRKSLAMVGIGICTAVGATMLVAQDEMNEVQAFLWGYDETPSSVSTMASGAFNAEINADETAIAWELAYSNLEGAVQQAHVHFGQPAATGPITVFLCTNLGNGPAGTPPCPAPPAVISGTITAASVTNLANERGISAGELEELIRAVRAGYTYANVHSTRWPGGEVRGQVRVPIVDGPGHHGQGNANGRDKN
jgi:hypothetical protein